MQIQLLQRFAYYLIQNARPERPRPRVNLIEEASLVPAARALGSISLPAIQAICCCAAPSCASAVQSTVDFVHLTFQDHLARSRSKVRDVGLLIRNGATRSGGRHPQMAVAQADAARRSAQLLEVKTREQR